MTTALFFLRCKQMGLMAQELEDLPTGFIFDCFVEKGNDECNYAPVATQDDFDRF